MSVTENRVAFSFPEYLAMTEQLVAEGRTTGPDQSQKMLDYQRSNFNRMQNVVRNSEILPETQAAMSALSGPQTWVLLAEPWCGDCAQCVPVIAAIAAANPEVSLQILIRADNLDLMDLHLTNGARAVPKLLMFDARSVEPIATWGPRPAKVQAVVHAIKAREVKLPFEEFVAEINKFYDADKGASLQGELVQLIEGLQKDGGQ